MANCSRPRFPVFECAAASASFALSIKFSLIRKCLRIPILGACFFATGAIFLWRSLLVYAPSDFVYWQHGHSTERDFIYVTTANLSHDQLQQLSDEVGSERSLLVVCSAFRGRKDGYGNLTVKKIPKAVLSRCEWGKDDYSLKVENLPKAPPPPGQMELLAVEAD